MAPCTFACPLRRKKAGDTVRRSTVKGFTVKYGESRKITVASTR